MPNIYELAGYTVGSEFIAPSQLQVQDWASLTVMSLNEAFNVEIIKPGGELISFWRNAKPDEVFFLTLEETCFFVYLPIKGSYEVDPAVLKKLNTLNQLLTISKVTYSDNDSKFTWSFHIPAFMDPMFMFWAQLMPAIEEYDRASDFIIDLYED